MNNDIQATILIVEDSKMNLKFLSSALGRVGFDILTAEDGETGLEVVDEQKPDLILLDIMMPGINGFETCRRLKANAATRSIPVIFMTALSQTGDKIKGFEVGAADYITKPFEIVEVVARVKTHLTLHRLQNDLRQQNENLRQENIKRARVQEALRESRWRYRLLAENSTYIISRQTLDGVYLYVSPACYTLLGYKIEDMIGQNFFDYVHPEDVERVQPLRSLKQDCPSVVKVTYRARHQDDSYLWLETVARSVCDSELGRPVEIVAVSRDVTERVELAQRLQQQNQELDAFAHTVAHDLKNPLGSVVTYADFLITTYDTLDDDKKKLFLQNIEASAQKGVNIIDELLLLATVRKEAVEGTPLDMADIIAEVLNRLQLMIEKHEGELIMPESWPTVVGHPPWIEEVWTNYISNGLKYGGDPPRLKLGATPLADGMISFWIKDNGQGLSEEEQESLFAEFVQLDAVRAEGHGLGLSIVRRIIEKLGGEVGVESEPGKGSTFYFTLPRWQPDDDSAASNQPADQP